MNVAVTSASGRLGSEIVKALLERETDVVGLARTPEKAAHLGIEIRPGDYDAPDDLHQSLRGVDAVLLMSGMDAPERRIQHRGLQRGRRHCQHDPPRAGLRLCTATD